MRLQETGKPLLIHVGAGLIAPGTWVNLDASWNARLAKHPWLRKFFAAIGVIPRATADIPWPKSILIHDVQNGLPFASGSAHAVYASHLIEHLSPETAIFFLQEAHRVLMPGGRIRLVTPDLEHLAAVYLDARRGNAAPGDEPASQFLNGLGVLQSFDRTSWVTKLYRLWKPYDLHKWLYDERSLQVLLCQNGFAEPLRRGFLESGIPNIADVEHEDRLRGAVCIEARKP